jgi:hypothetical protein
MANERTHGALPDKMSITSSDHIVFRILRVEVLGDQLYYISPQRREPPIEAGQLAAVASCQCREIRIGDLPMPLYALPSDIAISQVIRPEAVQRMGGELSQESDGAARVGTAEKCSNTPCVMGQVEKGACRAANQLAAWVW